MGTHLVKSRVPMQVEVSGIIVVAADGTTTSTGHGWSASRTAEGTYKLTLTDSFVSVDAVHVTVDIATGAWTGAYSTHTAAAGVYTVTLKTYTAGAAADADSGNIHFTLKLNTTGARTSA